MSEAANTAGNDLKSAPVTSEEDRTLATMRPRRHTRARPRACAGALVCVGHSAARVGAMC